MRTGKRGFTYILNHQYIKLEYLANHCEDLRATKISIINDALTRLFNRVKPYKELLETPEYKQFAKEWKLKEKQKDKKTL